MNAISTIVSLTSFLDLPDSYRIKHFGIYEILELAANHNFNLQKRRRKNQKLGRTGMMGHLHTHNYPPLPWLPEIVSFRFPRCDSGMFLGKKDAIFLLFVRRGFLISKKKKKIFFQVIQNLDRLLDVYEAAHSPLPLIDS